MLLLIAMSLLLGSKKSTCAHNVLAMKLYKTIYLLNVIYINYDISVTAARCKFPLCYISMG